MYNHNKAQQSKNRVHISWDILYKKRIRIIEFLFLYVHAYQMSYRFLIIMTMIVNHDNDISDEDDD